jgi:DNA-binding GntR family transcriptional regulator
MQPMSSSEIAEHLQQRIASGDLPSGARLDFADLMRRYDCSRATMQRAATWLYARGLAEYRPGRGVYVR